MITTVMIIVVSVILSKKCDEPVFAQVFEMQIFWYFFSRESLSEREGLAESLINIFLFILCNILLHIFVIDLLFNEDKVFYVVCFRLYVECILANMYAIELYASKRPLPKTFFLTYQFF